MIVGLGIDVASIERIERAIARFGSRFLARLLTEEERQMAERKQHDRAQFVAGRLAAKEASSKALGAPEGIGWHDVAVSRDANGAPRLRFAGKALERAEVLCVTQSHLSITHDAGVAAAVVVLEKAGIFEKSTEPARTGAPSEG
jgi:holo-[acyl-carrier protein] synthase